MTDILMNSVGAIAGYLIVLLFAILATYTYSIHGIKNKVRVWSTISHHGKNHKLRKVIQIGCISIALLNIPLLIGLSSKFNLVYSPIIVVGILASIFLFLTAISVRWCDSKIHVISAYCFFVFSVLYGLFSGFFMFSHISFLGTMEIIVIGLMLVTIPFLFYEHEAKGFTEVTFLSLNAILILLMATALLL